MKKVNKFYYAVFIILFFNTLNGQSQISATDSVPRISKETVDEFYHALSKGNDAMVIDYITKGLFPANYEPEYKITPLEAAIWANKLETVKILVENGANINSEKYSAIDACVERCTHMTECTEEEQNKTLEILKYLLSKGGNPNTKKNAFYLAGSSFYEAARYLLMAGAIIDNELLDFQRDKLRILLVAVERNDYEVLDKMAVLDDVINECNCGGGVPEAVTALTLAVKANNKMMVQYLLRRGADKNVPDKDVCYDDYYEGDTPYAIAKENGYTDIMEILK